MNAHPFSHLGPAPYEFIGSETKEERADKLQAQSLMIDQSDGNLCAGSCDHCGTAIFDVYRFRAADGTVFKVGSTCQEKARKEVHKGARFDRALEQAATARREAAKSKRHAREAAKLAEADTWIREHVAELDALPHPRGWAGQTLLDQLRWTWDNAGTAGKLKAYRQAVAA